MGNLKLTSSNFSDGGEIPRRFGYKNGNEIPALFVSEMPEGTKSKALIMDDPDAMGAVGKVWVHWVVWNIPFNSVGMIMVDTKKVSTSGTTDFGEVGYGGPAPPDKRHTYIFTLYALDSALGELGKTSTKADVEEAMAGNGWDAPASDHVIERTILKGTYAP